MQVAICVADVLDQLLDGALLGDIDLAIHHLCTQGPQGGQAGIIGQGRTADQDEVTFGARAAISRAKINPRPPAPPVMR